MTRKILITLCVFAMLFAQCTPNKKQLLKTSDIPSSFYTIDISKDTEVHTPKGMIMHIPKGTIVSQGAATVTLEVKEAYNMADMILGGLTTKAGKDLLSSGGMFYVNAAGGSNPQIVHPISISVPTRKQQKGMQLYKGVINSDSSIDWTAPQPLPEQAIDRRLAKGKVLYTDNCASCHNSIKNATGPALALLDKRRDWKWLESFVRNPALLIANGDPYANCIYKQFNKAAMTCYPTLTTEEIHMIFEYADEQAKDIDPEKIYDYKKTYDSCKRYLETKQKLEKERRKLVIQNGALVKVTRNSSQSLRPDIAPTFMTNNLVKTTNSESEYYNINIQAFGWYNIDILLKGLPGILQSELMVRYTGEFDSRITLFLAIPEYTILINGGLLKGKSGQYGFYTDDGMIPLPQGIKAYVFAFMEENGQLYFGKTDFITTLKQNPEIKIMATSKEEMTMSIRQMNFDIAVTKSQNADSIREIDQTIEAIEKLKPKNFDCNCGLTPMSDSSSRIIRPEEDIPENGR